MDAFRNCSISKMQCDCSTFIWLFPANRPLVSCHTLDSLIFVFLKSVSLPSRIYKLIIIQVNKLQVVEPSTQVWHHTPATPRERLSSSHAFRSVTFAYAECICGQTTRHVAARKVVQITVRVFLYHVLVDDAYLTRTVVQFLFASTLTNILENRRRNVSTLLILLIGAGLRTSYLTLHWIFYIWSLN
jgi:hypothetical protein